MSVLTNVITKIFGKKSDKDLKKILPIVEQINQHFDMLKPLSDDDLKAKFNDIKYELKNLIAANKKKLSNEDLSPIEIDDKLY